MRAITSPPANREARGRRPEVGPRRAPPRWAELPRLPQRGKRLEGSRRGLQREAAPSGISAAGRRGLPRQLRGTRAAFSPPQADSGLRCGLPRAMPAAQRHRALLRSELTQTQRSGPRLRLLWLQVHLHRGRKAGEVTPVRGSTGSQNPRRAKPPLCGELRTGSAPRPSYAPVRESLFADKLPRVPRPSCQSVLSASPCPRDLHLTMLRHIELCDIL